MIYNSLILPHLSYGVTSWGFGNTSRITLIQKRAIRSLALARINAHVEPLCKSLQLLTFDDLFKLSFFKFYFKFVNKLVPSYFRSFILYPTREVTRPMRTPTTPTYLLSYDFQIPLTNPLLPILTSSRALSQKRLRFFLPQIINTNFLPDSALNKIMTHSFQGFIHYSKTIIINKYVDVCNIPNCFVCNPNRHREHWCSSILFNLIVFPAFQTWIFFILHS